MDPDHNRAFAFEQSALRLLPGSSVTRHVQRMALEFPFGARFAELDQE
jgi:hypothetical protein